MIYRWSRSLQITDTTDGKKNEEDGALERCCQLASKGITENDKNDKRRKTQDIRSVNIDPGEKTN